MKLSARCHMLYSLNAWLTSKMEDTAVFMSLNPLGVFSHGLHTCLSPPVLNEPVYFAQHHSRRAVCLSSPRGKRGLRRGRPGRVGFPKHCRPSTGFLWSWRMLAAAELPLRPEEISGGEGNGQRVLC